MAVIYLKPNENIEVALTKFKKMVEKEGILTNYKEKESYKPPSAIRHERNQRIKYRKKLRRIGKNV